MQQAKIQLRDEAVGRLLGFLRPFQITALNVDDVGRDDGRLFLRVRCQENSENKYKFMPLRAQAQADLEVYLASGLPLYGECSGILFPNRFGERQTTRNLRYRHRREYGIEREVVIVGEPTGIEGIQWLNKWNRAEVVYFAQPEGKPIKIGHTRCFSTRFQALESEEGQMTLLGLLEGTKDDEAWVLNRFRHLLVRGNEWFCPAKELLDFINQANTVGREALGVYSDGGPSERAPSAPA